MDDNDPNDPWSERPRRTRWGVVVVLMLLLVAGAGLTVFFLNRTTPVGADVRATEGRLTLADDDGKSLDVVDRQNGPEVWYRVLLDDAPVGKRLNLTCDWVGPDGRVVHRNHYTTRQIDRPKWPTHARFRIDPNSALGTWTVSLKCAERILLSSTFKVQSGQAVKGAP